MNWRERIASVLGIHPEVKTVHHYETVVERRVGEAIANNRTTDVEWRSLYNRDRDLTPLMHDRHLEVARNLAATHPVAKRALEIHRDMVVADGIEIRATSKDPLAKERMQAFLDEWKEANGFDGLFPKLVHELAVSGELNLPAFVRKGDGLLRLGMHLAENVDLVRVHPYNALQLDTLRLKKWIVENARSYGAGERLDWKVIRQAGRAWITDDNEDELGYEPGVFVLQINNLAASSRGLSDLVTVADYLDRFHQAMHMSLDRMRHLMAFVWEVLLEGADENFINEWKQKHATPPKPNTVLPHNEKETWKAVTPDLKAGDSLELIREILKLILGALGVPIHFFVEAENVNRASAREMSDPVMARVRKRQEDLRDFFTLILRYVLHCARRAGRLQSVPEAEQTFEVVVREPDRRKLDEGAVAVGGWVNAYARAMTATFITTEEAGRGFRDKLRAYGDEFEEEGRAPVDPAAVQSLLTTQPMVGQRQETRAAQSVAQQILAKMSGGNGRVATPAA